MDFGKSFPFFFFEKGDFGKETFFKKKKKGFWGSFFFENYFWKKKNFFFFFFLKRDFGRKIRKIFFERKNFEKAFLE